ncbi:MAG: metallophosphoesterase family protein [Planctomycetota bacterium]|jgi:putative phosphoesterase
MLIGILSDSHGHVQNVRAAIAILEDQKVDHFIHCGDVCGIDVFQQFVGKPFSFVWGNCDILDQATMAFLETVGIAPPNGVPTVRQFNDKSIAIFHGHERQFENGRFDTDYVCHGHTHLRRDERRGATRIINPGALYRANPRSVATLNLANDELVFHEVK